MSPTNRFVDLRLTLKGQIAEDFNEFAEWFPTKTAAVEHLVRLIVPPMLQNYRATQQALATLPVTTLSLCADNQGVP